MTTLRHTKDPRDRYRRPGEWTTLRRSIDMADSTDAATASPEPGGWCDWHKGPASAVLRIRTIPRASGSDSSANSLYACAGCRGEHGLAAVERLAS
jgi:hypothetical protein